MITSDISFFIPIILDRAGNDSKMPPRGTIKSWTIIPGIKDYPNNSKLRLPHHELILHSGTSIISSDVWYADTRIFSIK